MAQATSAHYDLIRETGEFEALCARLIEDGLPFGFDIETSYDGESREHAQLHPEENFIAGLSFTNSGTWARYAPLRHDSGPNLDNPQCALAFWNLAQTGLGVAHNAKFEKRCMARWFMTYLADHPLLGAMVRESRGYFTVLSCTMLESYAEARNRWHGLKDITQSNFGHKMSEIFDLFPKRTTKAGEPRPLTKKEQSCIRFSELDQTSPQVIAYACEDALWALAHHYRRYPLVKDNFIYQLEMKVLPVVCAMEDEGVLYDWNFMREAAGRARVFLDKLAAEIARDLTRLVRQKDPDAAEVQINLGSPAQIASVLYDQLGLTTRRRTDSGKLSTDEVALTGLAKKYPVVRKILNWKSLRKLLGTYLETYETKFGYAPDGRTHPGWLQHGVPAGRFSASEPPVQQSPKKYHYELETGEVFDFNFRDALMAPAGWYILGFDYKNQELRVLAGEAQEPALIEAFSRGEDVHRLTASFMTGKPVEQITSDERQDFGKVMNFALSYQMGVDGLAQRLGISKDEAQALFDQYFSVYRRIQGWMERTVTSSKALGYVTTKFGRIVRIWEYESTNRGIYAQGERLAGNAPIQGAGTGDYTKIAMVRAHDALKQAGMLDTVRMIMNMHDALEFYVREDVPPAEAIRVLQPAVVFPVDGWPPIEAEWQVGRRWGSMKELVVLEDGSVQLASDAKAAPGDPGPVAGNGTAPGRPGVPEQDEPAAARAAEGPALVGSAMAGVDGNPDVPVRKRPGYDPVGSVARLVIVTLPAMPSTETWTEFGRLLGSRPGRHRVTVRTPEGEIQLGKGAAMFAITPQWEPQVSVLFGGATVTYAPDSVDTAALAAGLSL
jgi:DNA polymerase I-like protein with 3'-5' exonuclease and polymerase domains